MSTHYGFFSMIFMILFLQIILSYDSLTFFTFQDIIIIKSPNNFNLLSKFYTHF